MAISRFTASADTTITNAYKPSLIESTRATGSNMGAADVLETFSIYAQASGSTSELSRTLLKFPVSDISSSRVDGTIPASGSVNFYLRMFNAKHAYTTPSNYTLQVTPISQSWEEGYGLDMEEYQDDTEDGTGTNWMSASSTTAWTTIGGAYDTEGVTYSVSFDEGDEDLEVEITELVEEWVANRDTTPSVDNRPNYGLGVFLSGDYEAYHSSSALVSTDAVITGVPADGVLLHNITGSTRSYYTKKFFSRTSEYFFKRPLVEARWDSSIKDDRSNFYASSSLVDETGNMNTIYLYNLVRGQYKNIPSVGDGELYVRLYLDKTSSSGEFLTSMKQKTGTKASEAINDFVTGGLVPGKTGIYSASISVDTTSSTVYDRWFSIDPDADATYVMFHTGAVNVRSYSAGDYNTNASYVTTITNLKPVYSQNETARFRVYVRDKNWNPNSYTRFTTDISSSVVDNAYYRIDRIQDDTTVVDYGSGSLNHTLLSYDSQGNYFDFDMSMLEEGYSYGIKLIYKRDTVYHEQPETFKFRIE